MSVRSTLFLAFTLLVFAVASARADKCTGAKLKAIAKKESGLLGCQAKVASSGDSSGLSACETKVKGKFGSAFGKAGACGGDQTTCENLADTCETNVAAAMTDSLPSKCEAAKRKAAAKLAKGELGCYSRAAAKDVALDSAGCIAKATGKFSTGSIANLRQPNAAAAATCLAHAEAGTEGCSVCDSGTCNVDPDSQGAITTAWDWLNSVNAANFAGHSDWRLPSGSLTPSANELLTILSCDTFFPCIDPIFGPTVANYYWSATTDNRIRPPRGPGSSARGPRPTWPRNSVPPFGQCEPARDLELTRAASTTRTRRAGGR